MEVGLVYPYIIKSTLREGEEAMYDAGARRFLETLKEFRPEMYYYLHWVKCNESDRCRPSVAPDAHEAIYYNYDGVGFDVGVWMKVAKSTANDFVIFCNSLVFFNQHGWMERIVDARERYGPGLYGYSASLENNPHIRTTIWACDPKLLKLYPEKIVTRQDTLDFESGPKRFGRFIEKRKEPVLWVAKDGVYDQSEWASVKNGFRSGDQSNLLVMDRHIVIYNTISEEHKPTLTKVTWL